jgi:hypothetical protein
MTEQRSYNTQHFPGYILESLLPAVFPEVHKSHSRWLSLHLHNCRVHRPKASDNFFAENSIVRVSHPPHSPDLTPSKFWFFGHMKAAITDSSSDDDHPHKILSSFSDEDDSIPIDAVAIMPDDDDLVVKTDPEE